MKTQKLINVFISSPSDLGQEREAIREAMGKVNEIKGISLGYQFSPIVWDDDVLPTFGASPQEIIDAHIGDDYQVFLGLMSVKFGTPTGNAACGTQHEFEKAYERKINAPEDLEIMFYFQAPGSSGKPIDTDELKKVENFKSGIADKGIYTDYKTIDDFKIKIIDHLAKLMDLVVRKDQAIKTGETLPKEDGLAPPEATKLSNPLSIFEALDDIVEPGYIEISEDAVDALLAAVEKLSALTEAVTKLGSETQQQADELASDLGQTSTEDVKRTLKASSRSMDSFVETATAVLPLFHAHLAEGLELSREFVIMISEDDVGTKDELQTFQSSLEEMKTGMQSGLTGFEGLSDTIGSLPRATSSFNRSKRRTKAIVDGVCELIRSAMNEVDEIVQVTN